LKGKILNSQKWLQCFALALAALASSLPIASKCAAQGAPTGDPVTVLRDILLAACSEDSKQFSEHLTSRNLPAFSAMTPLAQSKFLQRFVLLDRAGTPQVQTDASGGLKVLCATTALTTQLQIGKPEIHDNVAYMSLVVKDAAESSDTNARRVIMGLVRENNQWKLLSLGVLLLDLPTLAEEWDRAEIQNNEKSAVVSIKELAAALEKYRITYARLPQSLADLGPSGSSAPKSDHAGLVDTDLAAGRKDGYSFRYVIVGANELGAPAIYQLAAFPIDYGRTGSRSFFRDGTGAVHAGDHQGAVGTVLDPKIE
jgi:hypothetical protein